VCDENPAGELMLHKTRGIIFHTTEYSETSIIAKVYTELFGVQSYIVNGVRKKKAKTRSNVFQPLTLVEMVVYHNERGGLQRLSEIRIVQPYKSIPFDIRKSSMVIFLDEILYRSLKEENSNPVLFEYLSSALQLLDLQPNAGNSFHLLFLLRLTRFLGFFPNGRFSDGAPYFDLQEGIYKSVSPSHPFFLEAALSEKFDRLVEGCGDLTSDLQLTSEERRNLLERTLEYYRLHIDGMGEVRSHRILEEVFA
jgi:DNA repair protein RecO (recombination protein O)